MLTSYTKYADHLHISTIRTKKKKKLTHTAKQSTLNSWQKIKNQQSQRKEKQKEHQGFGRHEKIQRWTSFEILIKSWALLGNLLAIYI